MALALLARVWQTVIIQTPAAEPIHLISIAVVFLMPLLLEAILLLTILIPGNKMLQAQSAALQPGATTVAPQEVHGQRATLALAPVGLTTRTTWVAIHGQDQILRLVTCATLVSPVDLVEPGVDFRVVAVVVAALAEDTVVEDDN